MMTDPGLRAKTPATKRLSHGTASTLGLKRSTGQVFAAAAAAADNDDDAINKNLYIAIQGHYRVSTTDGLTYDRVCQQSLSYQI
jgi:hypothetical protein